jgi:hypothetical protein
MRRVIVRYRVKPERVAEHEALLRPVFTELASTKPQGLRYSALRQADGVSFVHVAFIDVANNPLDDCAAFRAFTANIKDRCDEPPVVFPLEEIGAYVTSSSR